MAQWTPEEARAMAAKGGQAKARTGRKTPAERARESIADKTGDLAKELLDAALGRGAFDDLSSKDRLAAVVKALEYGLGRPAPAAKAATPSPDPQGGDEPGLEIG